MALQKDKTRDRILGAAENIFADKGYHEALVDEITEETALSKGGIYFHFPSKEDLFFAVLDRLAARLVAKVEKSAAAEASPLARAEASLVAVLSALGRKRRLARLLVVQGYSIGNPFEQKRVEIFGQFSELIKGHLDAAVAAGEIRPVDTATAAHAWLGAINEVVIRWLYDGGRPPVESLDTLRAVLIDGLRIEPAGTGA
ncbi:MAG: TetR/AcrR family transcriptional regulator [Chloroflexi bacterium]|nr:TetR/AcrR family transcriptional regulator [Chloroflexota bacterium]